jgi:hypothetical protein
VGVSRAQVLGVSRAQVGVLRARVLVLVLVLVYFLLDHQKKIYLD